MGCQGLDLETDRGKFNVSTFAFDIAYTDFLADRQSSLQRSSDPACFGARRGRQEIRVPHRRVRELETRARPAAVAQGQPGPQLAEQPDGCQRRAEAAQLYPSSNMSKCWGGDVVNKDCDVGNV